MANATWAAALRDTMLDPKAIDWWWTDYNGCAPSSWPQNWPLTGSQGCDHAVQTNVSSQALLWSNFVYNAFGAARGLRPLTLSRYGGIGNQRFGIGFSGDTQSTWATLKLQVAMTSTAANVLFGFWSHDIGGYNLYCPVNGTNTPCQCGKVVQNCNVTEGTCARTPAELYTRWLQFGALSPILRPHCSHCDKRIWAYASDDYARMRTALLFRQSLRPYLYTAARAAVDSASAIVRPTYHENPAYDEAYDSAPTQYLFGPSLLAAPVADALDGSSGAPATRSVWLPPGRWLYFNASAAFQGPQTLPGLAFGLDEYALFARSGAALPLRPPSEPEASANILWVVFADEAGGGDLYEDDGATNAYLSNASDVAARTRLSHSLAADGSVQVTVAPAVGTFPGAPAARRHVLQLRRASGAPAAAVTCNGAAVAAVPAPAEEQFVQAGFWSVPPALAQPWLAQGSVVVVTDAVAPGEQLACEVTYSAAPAAAPAAAAVGGRLAYLSCDYPACDTVVLSTLDLATNASTRLYELPSDSFDDEYTANALLLSPTELLLSLQYDAAPAQGALFTFDLAARRPSPARNSSSCVVLLPDPSDATRARLFCLKIVQGGPSGEVTEFRHIDRVTGTDKLVATLFPQHATCGEAIVRNGLLYIPMAPLADGDFFIAAVDPTTGRSVRNATLASSFFMVGLVDDTAGAARGEAAAAATALSVVRASGPDGQQPSAFLARVDLDAATFTKIGADLNLTQWTQLNALDALDAARGVLYLTAFDGSAGNALHLLGLSTTDGAIVYDLVVRNPFTDVVYVG